MVHLHMVAHRQVMEHLHTVAHLRTEDLLTHQAIALALHKTVSPVESQAATADQAVLHPKTLALQGHQQCHQCQTPLSKLN